MRYCNSNYNNMNTTSLSIAHTTPIFSEREVSDKMNDLMERESPLQENMPVIALYDKMLKKWADRFEIKPAGMPDIQDLHGLHPNFSEVISDIEWDLSLCLSSPGGLNIPPILLLWEPGIGKTYFAQRVAEVLGTGYNFISMNSVTAGWILSGSSSQWRWARPWKVFQTLIDGEYANPVVVVDEIDKVWTATQFDPLAPMYQLLEADTAAKFTDEYADVAVDASKINWVVTANDEHAIPPAILSRLRVYEVLAPDEEQSWQIANLIYTQMRKENPWGSRFTESPRDDLLEKLVKIWPRWMKAALRRWFGNASKEGRGYVLPTDIIIEVRWKRQIGF